MSDFSVPEEDLHLVDEFLSKFTIVSEQSMNEHIDILLMLRALPYKIAAHNFEEIELFDFSIF